MHQQAPEDVIASKLEKCVWLWMGHTSRIDPNFYDKFYRDKEKALQQYRITEKYLNIISGIQPIPTQDTKTCSTNNKESRSIQSTTRRNGGDCRS